MQKEGNKTAWLQTVDEVHILVPVDSDLRKQEVKWEVHPTRLRLQARGETLLEGDFGDERVDVDGKHPNCSVLLAFLPRILGTARCAIIRAVNSYSSILEKVPKHLYCFVKKFGSSPVLYCPDPLALIKVMPIEPGANWEFVRQSLFGKIISGRGSSYGMLGPTRLPLCRLPQ